MRLIHDQIWPRIKSRSEGLAKKNKAERLTSWTGLESKIIDGLRGRKGTACDSKGRRKV